MDAWQGCRRDVGYGAVAVWDGDGDGDGDDGDDDGDERVMLLGVNAGRTFTKGISNFLAPRMSIT